MIRLPHIPYRGDINTQVVELLLTHRSRHDRFQAMARLWGLRTRAYMNVSCGYSYTMKPTRSTAGFGGLSYRKSGHVWLKAGCQWIGGCGVYLRAIRIDDDKWDPGTEMTRLLESSDWFRSHNHAVNLRSCLRHGR